MIHPYDATLLRGVRVSLVLQEHPRPKYETILLQKRQRKQKKKKYKKKTEVRETLLICKHPCAVYT